MQMHELKKTLPFNNRGIIKQHTISFDYLIKNKKI